MGSLVLMLPSLARKPPQDRTMLEKMAAGMLEESLQKHVTDLEKQLEDTKEAAVSRDSEVKVAVAARASADEKLKVVAETVAEAEGHQESVNKEVTVLIDAVKARDKELLKVRSTYKAQQDELTRFRDGALKTYRRMLPEAEEETAAEDKAIAEAAASAWAAEREAMQREV